MAGRRRSRSRVGAQVGVALPSWLVFGRLPALGVIANLLAVPVAGVVMLVGIPCGIAAARRCRRSLASW